MASIVTWVSGPLSAVVGTAFNLELGSFPSNGKTLADCGVRFNGASPYPSSALNLTLSGGKISVRLSGTAGVAGPKNFTAVVYLVSAPLDVDLHAFTMTATNPAARPNPDIQVQMNTPPAMMVGKTYTFTVGKILNPTSGGVWGIIDANTSSKITTSITSDGKLTATPLVGGDIVLGIRAYRSSNPLDGHLATPLTVTVSGTSALNVSGFPRTLNGQVGSLLSAQLGTVSGYPIWVTFSWALVEAGTLDTYFGVSSSGLLSGTPLATGTYTGKVKISADPPYHLAYSSVTAPVSVSVTAPVGGGLPLAFSLNERAEAFQAVAYSQSLGTVTAPSSGASWALKTRGTLPANAAISSAGLLTATFPQKGYFSGTAEITASGYIAQDVAVAVDVIASTPIQVVLPTYPAATVNVEYSTPLYTLQYPSGGVTATLAQRGTLPANAAVSSSGELTATFAAIGSYSGKVRLISANPAFTSVLLNIAVTAAAAPTGGTINATWNALSALPQQSYSQSIGTVTVPGSGATFALTDAGTLPAGAAVSSAGLLTATFPLSGSYSGEVTVTASGYPDLVKTFTVRVGALSTLRVTPISPPNATAGVAYNATLGTVTVPASGATWALTSQGTLPVGTVVSSSGVMSATFASVGSYSGTVTISASGYAPMTLPVSVTVVSAAGTGTISVTMATLSAPTLNIEYHAQLGTVTSPTRGAVWTLTSIGTLPSGTLILPSGLMIAVFTAAGTYSGTVTISASGYTPVNRTITVTAAAAAPETMTLSMATLQNATASNAYVQSIGTIVNPAYNGTWSLYAQGTLPAGAAISSSGVLTATFPSAGTYSGTARASATGYTAENRTITVVAVAEAVSDPNTIQVEFYSPGNAIAGQSTTAVIGRTTFPATVTWTISAQGSIPDNATIAVDEHGVARMTFTGTQIGTYTGYVQVSADGYPSISHALSGGIGADPHPPIILPPVDPPPIVNPPPPVDPPPPAEEETPRVLTLLHIARDDGQGRLIPTQDSAGTVDYDQGRLSFPPRFSYILKTWSDPDAGGDGTWHETTVTESFTNASTVIVQYVPDLEGLDAHEETAEAFGPLTIDLYPYSSDRIIPNSVKFTIGSTIYQDYEGVVVMNPDANGVGTTAGVINYDTGTVVLHTWQAGARTFVLQSLATVQGDYTATALRFRVESAPLRPSGFTVAATTLDGELLSGTVDLQGVISGNGIAGTLDTEYGLCNLLFGEYVLNSSLTDEQKAEEWYDAEDILPNGTIWQPRRVFPSTVRYNAVSYTSVPVSSDIIGLDPVRLPSDGRVPIFVKGQLALVHQTSSLVENTLSPTQVLDTGEERLYRVALTDALGQLIGADQYVLDRAAGTVTMNANWSSAPYTAPFTLRYTIADLRIISAVDLSGKVTFNRALSHAYAQDDARLSGVLYIGTLQARVTNVFTQAAWTSVWQDTVIGTPPLARYNDIQYPVQVSNRNAYPDRFLIKFTSATEFQVIGENLGVIGTGSIAQDCSPVNTLTGYAYFTIPYQGWGVGWATGNCVRFNVVGACYPVDCARAIQPSEPSSLPDGATLLLIGNVDNA